MNEKIPPSGEGYVPPDERQRRFLWNEQTKNTEIASEKQKNTENFDFPALTPGSATDQNGTTTGLITNQSSKDFQHTSKSIWENLGNGNISYAHRTQGPRQKNIERKQRF